MAEDLLGAGLDIEGWSFLRQEVTRNVSDITDKSYLHRQQFPLLIKSSLPPVEYKQVHDIVIYSLELKSQIDPPWIAQRIKTALDGEFGASWHVIVGEEFTYEVECESHYFYYIVYASYAILAWKCGAVMQTEVNHIDDPKTKEKIKEAKLRKERKSLNKSKTSDKKSKAAKGRAYLADRI